MNGSKVIGMNTYDDRKDKKEEIANKNWRDKRKQKDKYEFKISNLTYEISDELMYRLNDNLKFNNFVDTDTLITKYMLENNRARK